VHLSHLRFTTDFKQRFTASTHIAQSQSQYLIIITHRPHIPSIPSLLLSNHPTPSTPTNTTTSGLKKLTALSGFLSGVGVAFAEFNNAGFPNLFLALKLTYFIDITSRMLDLSDTGYISVVCIVFGRKCRKNQCAKFFSIQT
jgi:hypothetical protein